MTRSLRLIQLLITIADEDGGGIDDDNAADAEDYAAHVVAGAESDENGADNTSESAFRNSGFDRVRLSWTELGCWEAQPPKRSNIATA